MALSLRRANAVKDALVREGRAARRSRCGPRRERCWSDQDGVREPQNRRVEIVFK